MLVTHLLSSQIPALLSCTGQVFVPWAGLWVKIEAALVFTLLPMIASLPRTVAFHLGEPIVFGYFWVLELLLKVSCSPKWEYQLFSLHASSFSPAQVWWAYGELVGGVGAVWSLLLFLFLFLFFHTKTWTWLVIAALLMIAPNWTQPKYTVTSTWMSKLWYMPTMEDYSTL